MKEISIFDAKTHFSGLVDRVYTLHESVTITRRGVKIAKIVPIEDKQEKNIATILRELQTLSDEIGHIGISVNDIKKMKEEGRR
jgi:prevent-host-death family protein